MKKEFYDFLFNMRASQFRHHTPEFEQEFYHWIMTSESTVEPFPIHNIDGDKGVISDSQIREYRNFMIGNIFIICRLAIQENADPETAYYISDYYLAKAEQIKCNHDVTELFSRMVRAYQNLIFFSDNPSYGYPIDKCINYISQNIYSNLTLTQTAEYMKLSPAYLTTLFKKHVGKSLYQYIQERKYKQAKFLLTYTSKSMTEIADALGYNSLAHLSRIFKTYSGMAPSKYRTAYKQSGVFKE